MTGIRGERLESAFESLLSRLQLNPDLLPLLAETVRRQWALRHEQTRGEMERLRRELVAVEQRAERLLHAFVYDRALTQDQYEPENQRLASVKQKSSSRSPRWSRKHPDSCNYHTVRNPTFHVNTVSRGPGPETRWATPRPIRADIHTNPASAPT